MIEQRPVAVRRALQLVEEAREHRRVIRLHDGEARIRYVWREAFQQHQLVNRPAGVVTQVLVAGHLAWEHGAYTPEFGRVRMGRVMRNREHEQERALAAA